MNNNNKEVLASFSDFVRSASESAREVNTIVDNATPVLKGWTIRHAEDMITEITETISLYVAAIEELENVTLVAGYMGDVGYQDSIPCRIIGIDKGPYLDGSPRFKVEFEFRGNVAKGIAYVSSEDAADLRLQTFIN